MAQDILLLEDVLKLGKSGDIVKVKPGYARNFLIPKQHAVVADKGAKRMQVRLQEKRRLKAEEDKKDSQNLSERIQGAIVEVVVKVDEQGHMYGSVSAQDIVKHLKEQHHIELNKAYLTLKHPIKEVGVHTIVIKLPEDVTCDFQLKINAEKNG